MQNKKSGTKVKVEIFIREATHIEFKSIKADK
jgi:hypothetical protein